MHLTLKIRYSLIVQHLYIYKEEAMKTYIVYLLLAISVCAETYKVVIQTDVYTDYQKFMNGRKVEDISFYGGIYSRRDVVEVLILQQALKLGGFSGDIDFIPSPTHERNMLTVKNGDVVARATTLWKRDADKNKDFLYKSYPIIENGDFEAGFYVLSTNDKALDIKNLSKLKSLKIASSKAWSADWRTLEKLGFYKVYNVSKWEDMIKMVKHKRMDVVLAPFQNTEDLSFIIDGDKFIPIKDFKIGIEGERVFAVSKLNPSGKDFITALNKGLKLMDRSGLIDEIYTESGFYNAKVKSWKKIKVGS